MCTFTSLVHAFFPLLFNLYMYIHVQLLYQMVSVEYNVCIILLSVDLNCMMSVEYMCTVHVHGIPVVLTRVFMLTAHPCICIHVMCKYIFNSD